MNIKVKNTTLEYAMSRPLPKRKPLKKPSLLFRTLVRLLSIPDLVATKFKYTTHRLEEAGKGPYLILMNHSSFIDLKIASKILYPTPYFIVSTSDSFVGKEWLMRELGCIPTRKFTNDVPLMRDMVTALRDKKNERTPLSRGRVFLRRARHSPPSKAGTNAQTLERTRSFDYHRRRVFTPALI